MSLLGTFCALPARWVGAVVIVFAVNVGTSEGMDNGLALTPPMGWRSWNCFGTNINNTLIMAQVDAIADRSRTVNRKNTSLLDLGFEYVGLDDGWMECNSGPGGQGYHDASGNPIVDTKKFPDGLAKVNQYGHSKGAKMGWYLCGCGCPDEQNDPTQQRYRGDVKALIDWGFDAVKIDGGGNMHNDSYFVELLNKTHHPILQLYSFSGPINATECPNNYHGVSGDIRPDWIDIARCLHDMVQWLTWDTPLSRPGCWAFPDMLEVGNIEGPLAMVETRTHFGAWCITSSPLMLGFDLTNTTIMDSVWDVISNWEAISVNQAWEGHPGFLALGPGNLSHPQEAWGKPMSEGRMAVLLINQGVSSTTVTATHDALHLMNTTTYAIRDVWKHADAGTTKAGLSVSLSSHDSHFVILSPTKEK